MPNFPNKREFARLPVRLQIEIIAGDISIRCEETRDISLKGVYVMTGHRIPLGVECDVAIDPGGPNHERRIQIKGHVARVDVSGIAIEFTEIGVDAFYELKKLLMINATNLGSIAKEVITQAEARKQV